MKKHYFFGAILALFILCNSLSVFAQNFAISGTISDSDGSPLKGASVAIKELNRSTSTDENGKYVLTQIKSGTYTITVSFVGYDAYTTTIGVNGATTANARLQMSNAVDLGEVVVIGYGKVDKKEVTGSIATVSSKDFQTGNIVSPEQLISGKVAGVQITSNSGQPGTGSTIRVRGGASLSASNDPLIVIDGVPLSGNSIAGAPSPLSLINPNDIETFTVLKDANATAIYGSRASNGVILITTKKGSGTTPRFNFSSTTSYSTIAQMVNNLSADQIRAYVNENGTDAQKALLGNANTNWQKEIYQNALTYDNNLSLSGNFEGIPYRISGGYLSQQGVLKTDQLDRATGGISISPKFFDKHLTVDLNLKGTMSDARYANQGAIGAAIMFDPTQPVYQSGSKYNGFYEWTSGDVPNPNAPRNPVGLLYDNMGKGRSNRSIGNVQFDYSFHFLPELHANANLGYDVSQGWGTTRVPQTAAQSYPTKGSFTEYGSSQKNTVAEFYLNYVKDIKALNSNVNVTAGYGRYDNSTRNNNFSGYNAVGEMLVQQVFPFDVQASRILSYYGRLIYTLADKYTLSGTMRTDASSRFSSENRRGYFPSVAFTWNAGRENFLKDGKAVSDLKFRLSYGITGQQDGIANYSYLSNYYQGSNDSMYQLGNQFYYTYSPIVYDKSLRWETTTTYNAGLDYGFANGRIYGSVDAYFKQTEDLLSTIPIPVGANFSNLLLTNVGNMENRGLEASINFGIVKSKNWNWDLGANFTYNQNKVTNLTLDPDPDYKIATSGITGATGVDLQYHTLGLAPNSFFVYKQIYDDGGKPIEGLYADLNSDGVINEKDRYFYHSQIPKYLFGLTTAINYKKLTISTVLRASVGNYIYDNVSSSFAVQRNILNPAGSINNATVDFYNTNFVNNQYHSDYYMHNASFLKMDNLSLNYDFGAISKSGTTTLRLGANCQNVFVWSDYKGIDPENTKGIDYNLYPRPRIFSLNVNVGF